MQIHFNNKSSVSFLLQAGTPQGSVLSPLLYIIYVYDIPLNNPNNCNLSQFADDIALWSTNKNSSLATEKLQEALTDIEN